MVNETTHRNYDKMDFTNQSDASTERTKNTLLFSVILARARETDRFNLTNSEKVFTKLAGMIAAPDMEAYEWIRMNVSAEFFNTRVVRIAYAHARTRTI
jgi:hypothetical protein